MSIRRATREDLGSPDDPNSVLSRFSLHHDDIQQWMYAVKSAYSDLGADHWTVTAHGDGTIAQTSVDGAVPELPGADFLHKVHSSLAAVELCGFPHGSLTLVLYVHA